MRLTLSILRCPDRVAPETRHFDGGEVVIGRGPGADWVLADPAAKPLLSRRHCTIAYRAGGWALTDSSTNGTTLNGLPAPEAQPTRPLRTGDRLGIGPYEIEVSLEGETQGVSAFGGGSAGAGGALRDDWLTPDPAPAASPFGSGFDAGGGFGGGAPFASGPPGASPFGGAPEPGAAHDPFAQPSIILPADFGADLLAPAPSRPPAQQDHSPAFGDVIQPPQTRTVLPSGWDDEPLFSVAPAPPSTEPPVVAPPASIPPFESLSAPAPPAAPAPFAAPPPTAPPETPTPFAELPVVAPLVAAQPSTVPRVAAAAPPVAASVVPFPAAAPSEADSGLLAAFLDAAGLADAQPQNPLKAMREAGAAFRAFVRGLRRVLIARAEVKSAFRIDQTMVRSRGNNPLKFAVSDDDALAALLGAGRHTDMVAADAVEGALTDIRLHELATMAAMQEAMTDLLGKLDPAKFQAAAEGGFLPAQKRARAYDLYEAEYRKLREAFTEKFDDAFGRAFARAYERVIADLQAREPLH